ncbi:MAG: hypothetical protein HWN66_07105 [Candidatus Helarchaeota archaeon]|nr:hypothetical protein [Candidatus Helarchaeota archaeon]
MTRNTYGDIPDTFPGKVYLPLGENILEQFLELGYDKINQMINSPEVAFFRNAAEFISAKFKSAVQSAKKVMSGEIKDPENVITTWFCPPVLYCRSDLQVGSTKLIYGDSADVTFICVNDFNFEPELLINGHIEDGVPVDYWYILGDDEVFERRHIKLGMKMREVPKKTKNFTKSGERILDILRDVRNERTPQWADSAYIMCMFWICGSANIFNEPSCWNGLASCWDGVNAKSVYGRPDSYFLYYPWPPIAHMMFNMRRPDFTARMMGLLTSHKLLIYGFEPRMIQFFRENVPEIWNILIRNLKEKGVTTPKMTMGCKPPDKKMLKNEEFDWTYPAGTRIMPYEWGLTDDEIFGGIYTDIDHETPEEPLYGKEHIITMGVGR